MTIFRLLRNLGCITGYFEYVPVLQMHRRLLFLTAVFSGSFVTLGRTSHGAARFALSATEIQFTISFAE